MNSAIWFSCLFILTYLSIREYSNRNFCDWTSSFNCMTVLVLSTILGSVSSAAFLDCSIYSRRSASFLLRSCSFYYLSVKPNARSFFMGSCRPMSIFMMMSSRVLTSFSFCNCASWERKLQWLSLASCFDCFILPNTSSSNEKTKVLQSFAHVMRPSQSESLNFSRLVIMARCAWTSRIRVPSYSGHAISGGFDFSGAISKAFKSASLMCFTFWAQSTCSFLYGLYYGAISL